MKLLPQFDLALLFCSSALPLFHSELADSCEAVFALFLLL